MEDIEDTENTEDSTFKRCEEIILYGSLYEALFSKFVKIEDILEYFLSTEKEEEEFLNEKEDDVRMRRMIAYRIVCIFSKKQKVRNSHFINLTKNEDFIAIYTFTYPSSLVVTDTNEDSDDNFEIIKKAQKIIPKLIKNANLPKFFRLVFEIGDKKGPYSFNDAFIISMTRCLFSLPNFLNFYKAFLLADYLEPLEHIPSNKYAEELIKRAEFLKEKAPLYWEHVAYPLYYSFIEKKFKTPAFDKKLIDMYDKIFPNLFSEKIKNRSEIVIKLLNKDKYTQAYCLGFPIHEYLPNEKNIEKALDKLQELGIEKYCEEIYKQNSKIYNKENFKIINLQNVNYDNIDEFNSFDVIFYYIDSNETEVKNMFLFSRPEFDKLLKDKKNFYTGEKLPESFKLEIKARVNIAKKYKLPESKTLSEMLSDLINFDDEEEEESEENSYLVEDDEDEDIVRERRIPTNSNNRRIIGTPISTETRENYMARVIDRTTGEELTLRLPNLPFELEQREDLIDEFLETFLSREGFDYLGMISCSCPECDRIAENNVDDEDDDEEEDEYENESL